MTRYIVDNGRYIGEYVLAIDTLRQLNDRPPFMVVSKVTVKDCNLTTGWQIDDHFDGIYFKSARVGEMAIRAHLNELDIKFEERSILI